MNIFKNKNTAKKLSQILSRVFNKEGFYEELLEKSYNDIEIFYSNLGLIMEYYIRTRDSKIDYSVEDFIDRIIPSLYSFKNKKDIDKQMKNTFEEGFLTHSCNGLFKENIEKNGLGSFKNRDDELNDKLSYLESILGCSMYLKQQKNSYDELYLTSPGATSIYYAANQSPERLFLGILRQEREDNLPIKVGETATSYYKRVVSKKISKIQNVRQDELKQLAFEIIDKFFFSKNLIIFIPMKNKFYKLEISLSSLKDGCKVDLDKYVKDNVRDDISFFFSQQATGGHGPNNLDDLVIESTLIPSSEIGIIEVPTMFDFLQMRAKNLGLKNGELIDYFTGEVIEIKSNSIAEKDYQTQISELKQLKQSLQPIEETKIKHK